MCMHAYAYLCIRNRKHIIAYRCTCTCRCLFDCICVCSCVYAYVHVPYTHTYMDIFGTRTTMNTKLHAYVYVNISAHAYAYEGVRVYVHAARHYKMCTCMCQRYVIENLCETMYADESAWWYADVHGGCRLCTAICICTCTY